MRVKKYAKGWLIACVFLLAIITVIAFSGGGYGYRQQGLPRNLIMNWDKLSPLFVLKELEKDQKTVFVFLDNNKAKIIDSHGRHTVDIIDIKGNSFTVLGSKDSVAMVNNIPRSHAYRMTFEDGILTCQMQMVEYDNINSALPKKVGAWKSKNFILEKID